MMLLKTFAGCFQKPGIAGCLLCTTRHWCAFSFHANRLSSFIFLTSSSYASDELGLLQILLKCRGNPPTPLQLEQKKEKKKKHKNTRVVICRPVIYGGFTLLGPASGIMDRKSPLHFNLDVLQPLPGSCVHPDGTRWSVPRYSAPLWNPGSVKMHCGHVMISNYADAEAVGRWSRRGECEEGEKDSRTKPDLWKNFHVHTDVSRCTELYLRAERTRFSEGRCASAWEGPDR